MSHEHIKVTEEAGVVTVALDRPERLNAFAGRMRRDLAEALERAAVNQAARVVVITGAGRAFCAGGDVAVMAELMERDDADEFARMLGAARRVVTAIRQMQKPVIASINGAAAGAGFSLALACDIRIASQSATFSQTFVRAGLHPDWGGTYFLPRIVPTNIACEMFFLGDAISAEQALHWGIVNRVVPDEELAAETRRFAERLRDSPPACIAAVKYAVYKSNAGASLEEMIKYETETQLRCFQSEDAREGVRAFLGKRRPRFSGR